MQTNEQKILAHLRRISPDPATVNDAWRGSGVKNRTNVYQDLMLLLNRGTIQGQMDENSWAFWVDAVSRMPLNPEEKRTPKVHSANVIGPALPPLAVAGGNSTAAATPQPGKLNDVSIVFQCAASKMLSAGHFRTKDGRNVLFVARPDQAPARPGLIYARPDDLSDDETRTWRERLVEYNQQHCGDNPLGLLPAYCLYAREEYRRLVARFGIDNVFILSAGWGLVRAAFLTPNYDITFSKNKKVAAYKRRRSSDLYRDFCQVPTQSDRPILFMGGRDYLPLFEKLATHSGGPKIIFHQSEAVSRRPGFQYRHYETSTRTNWHYLCAQDLVSGTIQIPR